LVTADIAFIGTTVWQVALRQTVSNHKCEVDSRSEEGSSGCRNENKLTNKDCNLMNLYNLLKSTISDKIWMKNGQLVAMDGRDGRTSKSPSCAIFR